MNVSTNVRERFNQQEAYSKIGKIIATLREFSGVPAGTKGKVIKQDDIGVKLEKCSVAIEWQLPGREKPLVDWFTKGEYGRYLKEV